MPDTTITGGGGETSRSKVKLKPMDFGHLKIRDDNVDALREILPHRFLPVRSEEGLVTGSFEDRLLEKAIRFFVVDNEYSCHDDEL